MFSSYLRGTVVVVLRMSYGSYHGLEFSVLDTYPTAPSPSERPRPDNPGVTGRERGGSKRREVKSDGTGGVRGPRSVWVKGVGKTTYLLGEGVGLESGGGNVGS